MSARTFSDPLSAAIAGLAEASRQNPSFEYGGVVLEIPGHFYTYTIPITDFQKDRIKIPSDYSKHGRTYVNDFPVVARFHTHACIKDYMTDQFSSVDVALDDAYHTDGYMLSMCTGNVYLHRQGEIEIAPLLVVWKGHMVGHVDIVDGHSH